MSLFNFTIFKPPPTPEHVPAFVSLYDTLRQLDPPDVYTLLYKQQTTLHSDWMSERKWLVKTTHAIEHALTLPTIPDVMTVEVGDYLSTAQGLLSTKDYLNELTTVIKRLIDVYAGMDPTHLLRNEHIISHLDGTLHRSMTSIVACCKS